MERRMDLGLNGKRALVTGSSSGIGAETALGDLSHDEGAVASAEGGARHE